MIFFTAVVLSLASVTSGMNPKHFYDSDENNSDFPNLPDNCRAICPSCPAKNNSLFELTRNDGRLEGLLNPSQYGTWVNVWTCSNKEYLFSRQGLEWQAAYELCCMLGMNLLSIQTPEDYECFAKAHTEMNGTWWTSGTDLNCTLNSKYVFSWCSNPQTLLPCKSSSKNFHTWSKKEPNNAGDDEKCLLMDKRAGVPRLSDKPCDNLYRYVCESPTTTPRPCTIDDVTCLGGSNYDPGFVYLTSGDCISHSVYGFEQSFFISKIRGPWADANEFCQRMGHYLISFDDMAEYELFVNTTKQFLKQGADDFYWTSATNYGCTQASAYKWCTSESMVTSPSVPLSFWSPGQPDNSGPTVNCGAIHVHLDPNVLPQLDFMDRDCEASHYFVCEANLG